MVAEMLQHIGVQNRQSAEKTKQPRYFAAHMAPPAGIVPHVKGIFPYSVRAQNPRTPPIKGTLKKKKRERELGRKEKEEKVKRGDLRERKLAAASSSTSRNHHCRAPSKGFAASREGQQA
ncbi:hypothetical protein V6N11_018294 [Hibiscus sabdariffa]|uniref:Uncharacterized protein n=1 Tax=Hibiscus sabdariffa TaxID=183260 RepID=A0ABR2T7F6_9ROSI